MGYKSEIEWTDRTWNPVTGCTKVFCAHCYAETIAKRLWATTYPPVQVAIGSNEATCHSTWTRPRRFEDVQCHEDRLRQPLSWRKPARIFVNSMSDLFHEDVPDAFIDRVFAVMAVTEWHTYQILTKRADRMRAYVAGLMLARLLPWINDVAPDGSPLKRETPAGGFVPTGAENLCTVARRVKERVYRLNPDKMPLRTLWPLPNVWLGVSVENQRFADERIPLLLQTPAAVRFISAEPLLGPVDLSQFLTAGDSANPTRALNTHGQTGSEAASADTSGPANAEAVAKNVRAIRQEADRPAVRNLDWVIVGGESGPKARPFDVAWARSIVSQCKAAGVPCFVKQLGTNPHERVPSEVAVSRPPIPKVICDRKGGDPAEWPADLRVREFPC